MTLKSEIKIILCRRRLKHSLKVSSGRERKLEKTYSVTHFECNEDKSEFVGHDTVTIYINAGPF